MDSHQTPVSNITGDDVMIERVVGAGADSWRVTSSRGGDAVVAGKPAAIDAALARIEGTRGRIYIREDDGEAVPFNPAGA